MDGMFGGGSGAFGISDRKVRRSAPKVETMKALAFSRPYARMLINGLLKVGRKQVKTRNQPWEYRGPLLIYTNAKPPHQAPIRAYGFREEEIPKQVISCVANLVDVRLLTESEKNTLFLRYNNLRSGADIGGLKEWVEAMDYGYFLDKVTPIFYPVEKWPSGGPIANVPLTRDLKRQLPDWAR